MGKDLDYIDSELGFLMKNILVINDNNELVDKLRDALSVYHIFSEVKIFEAKTYKEATLFISNNPDSIEVAVVNTNLPDVTEGKALMLVGSNNISSVALFDSFNSENKLHNKLLTIKGVVKYFEKNNQLYIDKVIDFIHKTMRNSAYTALVVDDSLLYREKFKNDLQDLNLNVIVAKDGQEALDIFNSKKYEISLLITDYNMPRMDGIELVKILRKTYSSDILSIIAISIDAENKTLTKFIKVGANDYIYKPYSVEELSVRVNSNINTLEMFEKISNLANRDFLTGAYNRRYFFETSNAIVAKNYRKQTPIILATIDIDKFKNINDTYGHDIGDIAIKDVVKILSKYMRNSDLVARFGGEEFCILLEEITLEDAKSLFEKIRMKFETNKVVISDELSIGFTVSIGVSYIVDNDISKMIKISDNALYEAKETGRNKVVIHNKL